MGYRVGLRSQPPVREQRRQVAVLDEEPAPIDLRGLRNFAPREIEMLRAHHVDSGVPMRNLPRYHRLLVASGYVQPGLEYPNYTALWRKLAGGAPPIAAR